MKVVVVWENSLERELAENLVRVIKKIGSMLIYGKVETAGVLFDDWKGKPVPKIDCYSINASGLLDAGKITSGSRTPFSFVAEYPYRDGVGYTMEPIPLPPTTARISREAARDMVRSWPGSEPQEPPKPVDTTGVTVRALDIEEDDEHCNKEVAWGGYCPLPLNHEGPCK